MAKIVRKPSDIRLKTSSMVIRSTEPRSERITRNDNDSTWKSGLAGGTNFEDYKLDMMKLS